MTREFLPPEQWYETLPTVYASACGFITDARGRVLLVKPNYRPYWALPGGLVDEGELPHEACVRELREELGLTLGAGALLAVDWAPAEGVRPRPMVNWLFDAGELDADTIARIRLQEDELDDFALVAPDDAKDYLPGHTSPRVAAALTARRENRTVYLPR
ncbi:NUDIX hydrolase [Streptodolium elevatio]|uniref:NUDIX hydrolase n=1 Tax=Streptodolium elevatio TaxID=3157996 RepID=A0ABV3DGB9_9ACTN